VLSQLRIGAAFPGIFGDAIFRLTKCKRAVVALVYLGFSSFALAAQQPSPVREERFTLQQAVEFARAHYPEARASLAKVMAARAAMGLARTSYLPRTDLLWQTNRSTYNNITGLLLPQSVMPSLSGTVLTNSSDQTLWGSAGGALFSWQPFDFGLRAASVNVARAGEHSANYQLQLTNLDVSASAADAFLAAVVAQQARRVADADVGRRETFAKVVHSLVDNQLRPGVEGSRADAELAAARTQLLRAEESEANSRITLAEALGIAGQMVQIDAGPLASTVPAPPGSISIGPPTSHPLAELAMSAVDEFRARRQALERSYFPSFYLQSAVAARGSGAKPNGAILEGTSGLAPDRYNFGVGITAAFPVFDFFSLRSRKQIESANEENSKAEYDKTMQQLSAQLQRAQIAITTARQIADNTGVELKSAEANETQATARYRASLANAIEVSEAQHLLVQAETDDAVAKVSLWRALLSEAFAEGNLQPFMDSVQHADGGH
jgi:outer membrane protein